MFKRIFTLYIIIILIVTFSACNNQNVSKKEKTISKKSSQREILKDLKPIIFIHGYSGTENSLKKMISRLDKSYENTFKSLVIDVNSNGELSIAGTYKKGKINLIQIIFENNTASIENQSEWIETVLEELGKRQINETDVVAHSMGGEATTYYLEYNRSEQLPKIKSFVPIGTPFTWNFGGPDESLATLETLTKENIFVKEKNNLPKNLSVFAIAGEITPDINGDGIVPLISSTFGKYIFDQVEYKEVIVKGEKAEHRSLHENDEVDKLVADFLIN